MGICSSKDADFEELRLFFSLVKNEAPAKKFTLSVPLQYTQYGRVSDRVIRHFKRRGWIIEPIRYRVFLITVPAKREVLYDVDTDTIYTSTFPEPVKYLNYTNYVKRKDTLHSAWEDQKDKMDRIDKMDKMDKMDRMDGMDTPSPSTGI
jgi:hypothetical protein